MKDEEVKKIMLKHEDNFIKYACKSSEAVRFKDFEEDIRPNFFRDTDRIIHSSSYTRYMDKTQVFTKWDNDNISKRMVHVQLVSKIARTIGRALSLNEDLIEASSLGHDLGHVPFGHVGEAILDEISIKYTNTHFSHNVQSVRNLMYIERNGEGINASVQVLDSILCHNGELVEGEYYPVRKSCQEFLDEYNKCYVDNKFIKTLHPMTLEGCVVRISDIIGYLGRDIEDAIRLKVIKKEDLPKSIVKILGSTNTDIINTIITDIIKNSLNKPYIKLSDDVLKAIKELKKFNYEHIYYKAYTIDTINYYKQAFNEIFVYCLKNIDNGDSIIQKDFLSHMNKDYLNNNSNERKVIDFIAGMTDDYFIRNYNLIK